MSDVLAALDIGTNSFHLVVARTGTTDRFEVIARSKELVRLGSGSDDMSQLEPDAIDRGIEALVRLGKVAASHGADIYAVATSAVREADNADEFLRRARLEAGIDIQVISGPEEARLIHLGVLQAVPVFDRRLVLMDIGGGSTEILVGEQGETLAVTSLKVGALRLTQRFFRSSRLHPSAVDACRRWLRSSLAPVTRQVRRHGFDVAIGSSGTVATLCAMVHAQRGGDPLRTFNNFSFTADELAAVVELLISVDTAEQRRKLPGLDPSRADIILAGALIAEQVMAELGIDEMVHSDYALREGALLDALHRRRGGTLHHLHDLRRRSVEHLAATMDDDPAHSAEVARLALELFDLTHQWHGASSQDRELLEAAALLTNVGLFVSHDGYHKHSYYIIRHTEHLAGFTDNEIELIAQVARYHRKSPPKPSHPTFAALNDDDQNTVRVLAAILRVAIGLDRTHNAVVATLGVRLDGDGAADDAMVLEVGPRPGVTAELELFTATENRSLLEQVLGRPIRMEAVGARR
jgi:exopolyphosphatase / guanosine-5'-triphosphate,3'-diphosphate pyrophosphatase